jgi:hypothetical protein
MVLSYGNGLLNALRNVAVANLSKVMLELGIKVDGKRGVPFGTGG